MKMKRSFIILVLLCSSAVVIAQNTVISANVVDSDGTTWTNGTWSITFTPNPQQPNIGIYNINGTSLSPSILDQQGVIDASGNFNITVYQSTAITPVGSSWTLNICPNASAPCGVFNLLTSGSTMNISTLLTSGIPPPRFKAIAGTYGYTDIEAQVQLTPGSTYYNVVSSCQKYFSFVTSTWSCFASGGTFLPLAGGTLSGPLVVTTPGIFTNLASHSANQGLVNGASLAMFLSSGPANYTMDGVTGAIIVPSTATVSQANGVDGMTDNYTNSNALAAMGGYFQVTGHGTNENLWGINTVGIIYPGSTNTALENEVDFDVNETGATIYGWSIAAPYWNFAPSVAYGVLVSTPGGTSGAKWNAALYTTPGATSNGVELLELNIGVPSVSQPLTLISGTSNGTQYNESIQGDATGNILLNPFPGQSVIIPKFGGNPIFTGLVQISNFDASVTPIFNNIGTNGLNLSPAVDGASPNEIYGSNHANSQINWHIDDIGDAFFKTANIYNSARTFVAQLVFSGTSNRSIILPDGASTTSMPWSLTTTSATSDIVTLPGMTISGHCSIASGNSSAAANIGATYYTTGTNQITITHATTASMIYTGSCTNN
jgi:hypothetical protein